MEDKLLGNPPPSASASSASQLPIQTLVFRQAREFDAKLLMLLLLLLLLAKGPGFKIFPNLASSSLHSAFDLDDDDGEDWKKEGRASGGSYNVHLLHSSLAS